MTLYLASKDPRVPLIVKLFIVLIVGYALSPIDFIPDFIPILGYLDDVVFLPLAVHFALKWIPKEVLEELREEASRLSRLKKNWIAGGIVLLVWILLVLGVIYAFFRL